MHRTARSHPQLTILATLLVAALLQFSAADPAAGAQVNDAACPDGYDLDASGTTCTLDVAATLSDPACPDGTLGEPGACYAERDPVPSSVCSTGGLIDGQCVTLSNPSACPDGYSPDGALGGICAMFEPAQELPASCPEGTSGEPGGCYFLVARLPGDGFCEVGELLGQVCVIYGEPPVAGPGGASQCEAGFGVLDGQCVQFVGQPTIGAGACPDDSTEVDGECRKSVPDNDPVPYCEDPQAALNGSSCVYTATFVCGSDQEATGGQCATYTTPTTVFACPPPSTETDQGCTQAVADAPRVLECTQAGSTLTGDRCTARVAAARCGEPAPSWFQGELRCDDGSLLLLFGDTPAEAAADEGDGGSNPTGATTDSGATAPNTAVGADPVPAPKLSFTG